MNFINLINPKKSWIMYLLVFMLIVVHSPVEARDIFCGALTVNQNDDGGGPWDYTDPMNRVPNAAASEGYLHLVERAHFTPQVEQLIRGKTGVKLLPDISYTLYRFPNHHRALWALSRLQRRNGGKLPVAPSAPVHARYAECYFEKAILFKSEDSVVHMLYGMHLHSSGDLEKSEQKYKKALELNPGSSELHYNMGLLYFDMRDFDSARRHAGLAYESGYPLQGLRRKLDNLK
ncbi:tetratricopeptide repeat protein [Pseudomonadota bacterium]